MNATPGEMTPLATALARAHAAAGRGAYAEAAQAYRQVLDHDREHVEALTFLGQAAMNEGQFTQAAQLLERAVAQNGGDAPLLRAYGHACIGAERFEDARDALARALALAPEIFVVRLHLGYALERLGHADAAVREYFRAITSAQANGRWLTPQTTAPALQQLVVRAMRFVDAGRERRFRGAFAQLRRAHGDAALRRVDECLDVYLGDKPMPAHDVRQKPKFLYVPQLPTTAYFARELFDWYAELERHTDAIRAELLAVLRDEEGMEPFLKFTSPDAVPQYLGAGPQGPPAWDAYFFYRHGKRYEENCARCPTTAAIIETLPLARIRAHAPEICFSVLAPGTHILPHHGVTNARLVTHLPLIVPGDCAIRVGGEEHAWAEGRCVTFDDTFEHEAWNRSDSTRVVLILDHWNPHLSAVECEAIAALVAEIGDFNRECGVPEA
jgi:aspartate beta-hydroxylase